MPEIGTRELIFMLDGNDFSDAISVCKVTAGDKEAGFISFLEARTTGSREYKLSITTKQSFDADALFHYAWAEAGSSQPIEIWPCGGGVTPSTDTPKLTGTVVISEPDGDFIGTEANKSVTARATTTMEWTFENRPTLVTA